MKTPSSSGLSHWLMKSEPESYSIDRLAHDRRTRWEGVRNYQARNFMTTEMKVGDLVLFYHSNASPPGAAGVARVSQPASADLSAQDAKSPYFDPKAKPEKPIWMCVEVEFVAKFKRIVSLDEIRSEPALAEMPLLQRGQRLSIQKMTAAQFAHVLKMADKPISKLK